jgi:hypothetical protein
MKYPLNKIANEAKYFTQMNTNVIPGWLARRTQFPNFLHFCSYFNLFLIYARFFFRKASTAQIEMSPYQPFIRLLIKAKTIPVTGREGT